MIALLLMIADQYNNAFHRFRSDCDVLVVPIQYFVSLPVRIVNFINTDIASQQKLVRENTQLRAETLMLKARLQKQYAIENDNAQLKALLRTSSHAEGKVLEAQLLAVSPDPFLHQVVVNKGSNDHVFVGQPVLDANGVMGQVVQVGKFTCRVMLLTDAKSAIPVEINRNGIRAIAVGEGAVDQLKLKNITTTTDVKVGDVLVTSGLGEHFAYGYPVGQVISINNDAGDQFADITVEPAAHLNRSRLVLLVWPVITEVDSSILKNINEQTVSGEGK